MYIKEVFYSFQGEGPWIGYPQIFVRFYGCNIHCAYCDEPDYIKDRHAYTADRVLAEMQPFLKQNPHSVSITGGEPLVQVGALKTLLPQMPLPVYLETNGILAKAVAEIADWITYFSVDYKNGFSREFSDFMQVLKGRQNVYVKYVLLHDFPEEEMKKMLATMATLDPMPLVIQPVTPFADVKEKATLQDIQKAYDLARCYLPDVRVIPQAHKMMGLK